MSLDNTLLEYMYHTNCVMISWHCLSLVHSLIIFCIYTRLLWMVILISLSNTLCILTTLVPAVTISSPHMYDLIFLYDYFQTNMPRTLVLLIFIISHA